MGGAGRRLGYSRARWAGPVDLVISHIPRAYAIWYMGSVCTGGFELKQIFEDNAKGTARVLNLIFVTVSHCL